MTSVLSKSLILASMLLASVGILASPAIAAPSTADVGEASIDRYVLQGNIQVREGIRLGAGKLIKSLKPQAFEFLELTSDHTQLGMRQWYRNPRLISSVAAYPITLLGEASEFWVQMSFKPGPDAACEIFRGEPGSPGSEEPTWSSPLKCRTSQPIFFSDEVDFTIDLVDDQASISGGIRTEGPVSLGSGTYTDFDISWSVNGNDVVSELSPTRFFSVLRTRDLERKWHDYAEIEFRYNVVDNGASTYYTLFGGTTSRGEEKCYILPVGGPYECQHSGRSNSYWERYSDFVVTKR